MTIYVFFREGGFYSAAYQSDEAAILGARRNLGTIRVERMSGEVVWELFSSN